MIDSDQSEHPPDKPAPADGSDSSADARPGQGAVEPYSIEEPTSLLSDSAQMDVCPNCGKPMPYAEAIVCLECGFDQVQNKIIRPKIGADEIESESKGKDKNKESADSDEFVQPGRLGWKAPLIVGGVLIIIASVLSGMNASSRPILHAIATFLYAPVYAGIGVAAVMTTAILMEQRFGKLEFAVGRMMLAVGLAELSWHIAWSLGLANPLPSLIGLGAGSGLYFLIVWWTFSLNRTVATLLSLLHLSLWVIFLGLLKLSAALATTPAGS